MDRRQQKTRDAIFDAFIKLLSHKSYSKITVQEIIDLANVGRTTFYAHFATKDELLREMCTDLFDHVFSDSPGIESTHDFSLSSGSTNDMIAHILYHLRDSQRNILGILACESGALLLQFFKEYLNEMIAGGILREHPGEDIGVPDDYLISHISSSFINLVQWWMKCDLKQSPEELSGYFSALISPVIAAK